MSPRRRVSSRGVVLAVVLGSRAALRRLRPPPPQVLTGGVRRDCRRGDEFTRLHTFSTDTFSDDGDDDEDDSLTVSFALVDLADEEDGLLVDSHPVFVCAEQLLHVFFYTTEQCIMGKFKTLWLCLKSLTTPSIVTTQ